jgi:hypothetical protein
MRDGRGDEKLDCRTALAMTLSPWMMHTMQTLQPLPRHMRVNLRGANIRMPQQHLHHA